VEAETAQIAWEKYKIENNPIKKNRLLGNVCVAMRGYIKKTFAPHLKKEGLLGYEEFEAICYSLMLVKIPIYAPEKGAKIQSYLIWCIRQALNTYYNQKCPFKCGVSGADIKKAKKRGEKLSVMKRAVTYSNLVSSIHTPVKGCSGDVTMESTISTPALEWEDSIVDKAIKTLVPTSRAVAQKMVEGFREYGNIRKIRFSKYIKKTLASSIKKLMEEDEYKTKRK